MAAVTTLQFLILCIVFLYFRNILIQEFYHIIVCTSELEIRLFICIFTKCTCRKHTMHIKKYAKFRRNKNSPFSGLFCLIQYLITFINLCANLLSSIENELEYENAPLRFHKRLSPIYNSFYLYLFLLTKLQELCNRTSSFSKWFL